MHASRQPLSAMHHYFLCSRSRLHYSKLASDVSDVFGVFLVAQQQLRLRGEVQPALRRGFVAVSVGCHRVSVPWRCSRIMAHRVSLVVISNSGNKTQGKSSRVTLRILFSPCYDLLSSCTGTLICLSANSCSLLFTSSTFLRNETQQRFDELFSFPFPDQTTAEHRKT